MLTRQEARAKVAALVCGPVGDAAADDEVVIVDDATIERQWGWVFFFTSRKWHETGDIAYALAGNAPLIVERVSGNVVSTGTAFPVEHYMEAYERTGRPHG